MIALLQVVISVATKRIAALMPTPYVKAAVLGAGIGAIAFALPLTASGGSVQLAFATEHVMSLGLGLLLATLVAKMLAMALSQAAGFLGGSVFPMLFIGGTAGMVMHELFPAIPVALAVAAMLAALPGSIIGARSVSCSSERAPWAPASRASPPSALRSWSPTSVVRHSSSIAIVPPDAPVGRLARTCPARLHPGQWLV